MIAKDEVAMYYNAITVCRYVCIFWLKNPTAIEDNFWIYFVNIWILISCTLYAIVYEFMPNQQYIYNYTCCGFDPGTDAKLPGKPDGILLIVSIILQLVLHARIFAWKHSNRFFNINCLSSTEVVNKFEQQT